MLPTAPESASGRALSNLIQQQQQQMGPFSGLGQAVPKPDINTQGREGRLQRLALAKLAVSLAQLDTQTYETLLWVWYGERPELHVGKASFRKLATQLLEEVSNISDIVNVIDEVKALIMLEQQAGLTPTDKDKDTDT